MSSSGFGEGKLVKIVAFLSRPCTCSTPEPTLPFRVIRGLVVSRRMIKYCHIGPLCEECFYFLRTVPKLVVLFFFMSLASAVATSVSHRLCTLQLCFLTAADSSSKSDVLWY